MGDMLVETRPPLCEDVMLARMATEEGEGLNEEESNTAAASANAAGEALTANEDAASCSESLSSATSGDDEDDGDADSSHTHNLSEKDNQNYPDLCGGFRLFSPRKQALLKMDHRVDGDSKDEEDEPLSLCLAAWEQRTTAPSREEGGDTSATPRRNSSSFSLPSSPSFAWLSNLVQANGSTGTPKSACSPDTEVGASEAEASSSSATSIHPATDLGRPRRVYVVTTAALPWTTGTAINPLLRAAYLYERYCDVTTVTTAATVQSQSSVTTKQLQEQDEEEEPTSQESAVLDDNDTATIHNDDEEDGVFFYDAIQSIVQEHGPTFSRMAEEEKEDNPTVSDTSGTSDDDNDDDFDASSWHVTLVVPWLEARSDRGTLYGNAATTLNTPEDQEVWIRQWLRDTANLPRAAEGIRIEWYQGRYYPLYRSIFPTQDLCAVLQALEPSPSPTASPTRYAPHCPVCILEEPEHLLVYRAKSKESSLSSSASNGTTTTATSGTTTGTTIRNNNSSVPPSSTSPLSVGNGCITNHNGTSVAPHPLAGFYNVAVMHTNYKMYVAQGAFGMVSEMLIATLFAVVTQAYADRILKLSATLQTYARHKELVCNVHGIRQDFLNVPAPTGNEIYYIGKLLWAKGLDRLLRLQRTFGRVTGRTYFACTIYGNGPDEADIRKAFRRRPVVFAGRVDHAQLSTRFKIFVNPSVTEVLCTTTAEALAMNKFVLLPEHPSNGFFETFPNALFYKTPQEFCHLLVYAQTHDPVPLDDALRHRLSWAAATDRLISAAAQRPESLEQEHKSDAKCYHWHAGVSAGRLGQTIHKSFWGTFSKEEEAS